MNYSYSRTKYNTKRYRNLLSDINEGIIDAQVYGLYEDDIDDSFISQEPERKKAQTRVIYLNNFIHPSEKYSHKGKGRVGSLNQIDIGDKTLTTKEFLKTETRKLNIIEPRRENNQQDYSENVVDRINIEAIDDVRTVADGSFAKEYCSNVRFSRMKSMPNGSICVICEKSRVAMLILWSVKLPKNDRAGFNIQVAPLINCDLYDSEILIGTAKYIGMALTEKFLCHNYDFHDYTNQTEALQLFDKLTQFILSLKTEIFTMISERIAALNMNNSGNSNVKVIQRALQLSKYGSINVGISLDHLDIYKKMEKAEMEALNLSKKDSDCIKKGKDDVSCCPICFDAFDGDQMSLAACNHQVCPTCWRGLLRSAASSGGAIIKCPYFRCSNILGICEIAHIMFNELYATSDTADILSSSQVLMDLARFQIEQYISTSATNVEGGYNFRFCRTPSCNRTFCSKKNAEKDRQSLAWSGSNVIICACGSSLCADCKGKGLAHLGLTCDEYKKVRKEVDSGRMDDEFKSLQWMDKNAEPCPKCNFPINKNGGCNHVWCTKCSHYFCWLCKGPGNMCNSYSCTRSSDQSSDTSAIVDVEVVKATNQIQQFRALKIAEEQYYDILKRGALECGKNIALQVQLVQTTVWVRAYLATHTGNTKRSTAKLKHAITSLEHILYVISMKNDKQIEATPLLFNKRCINAAVDSFSPEEFHIEESLKRKLTTRKMQALNQIAKRRFKNNIFSAQFESPKLSFSDVISILKLISMNVGRFKVNAISEMCTTIGQLNQKHTRRTRMESEKYPGSLTESGSAIYICPLNRKAKPLNASWKNKLLLSTSDKGRINNRQVKIGKGKIELSAKVGRQRWNGKSRVKVRRSIALESWLDAETGNLII